MALERHNARRRKRQPNAGEEDEEGGSGAASASGPATPAVSGVAVPAGPAAAVRPVSPPVAEEVSPFIALRNTPPLGHPAAPDLEHPWEGFFPGLQPPIFRRHLGGPGEEAEQGGEAQPAEAPAAPHARLAAQPHEQQQQQQLLQQLQQQAAQHHAPPQQPPQQQERLAQQGQLLGQTESEKLLLLQQQELVLQQLALAAGIIREEHSGSASAGLQHPQRAQQQQQQQGGPGLGPATINMDNLSAMLMSVDLQVWGRVSGRAGGWVDEWTHRAPPDPLGTHCSPPARQPGLRHRLGGRCGSCCAPPPACQPTHAVAASERPCQLAAGGEPSCCLDQPGHPPSTRNPTMRPRSRPHTPLTTSHRPPPPTPPPTRAQGLPAPISPGEAMASLRLADLANLSVADLSMGMDSEAQQELLSWLPEFLGEGGLPPLDSLPLDSLPPEVRGAAGAGRRGGSQQERLGGGGGPSSAALERASLFLPSQAEGTGLLRTGCS